jgi:hypothetical protein
MIFGMTAFTDRVRDLYVKDRLSVPAIAAKTGRTRRTIYNHLHMAKVELQGNQRRRKTTFDERARDLYLSGLSNT